MSAEPTQHFDKVFDSCRARFNHEIWLASSGIRFAVNTQLQAAPKRGNGVALFKKKQKIFRSGLGRCLESLVEIVPRYVQTLATIGFSHPEWVTGDTAVWARSHVKKLLNESVTPQKTESWIMWASCGSPGDRPEPCSPPFWCLDWSVSDWERWGRPSCLSAELTAHLFHQVQEMFVDRLDFVLEQAEHKARIDLASAADDHLSSQPIHGNKASHKLPAKQTVEGKQESTPPKQHKATQGRRPDKHDLTQAKSKCADPASNPSMNAREVAAILGLSLQTVYDHRGLDEVRTGTRRRRWTTLSVIAIQTSPPE